jgi:Skp family chaperone for outer membrane proteins
MKPSTFASRSALAATGLALATALFTTSPVLAQAKPPAPQGFPMPKILVIDRQALLRQSKVGQSIAQQVQGLTKSAEIELKGENESLRREGASLQQQVAILAPDVRAQKVKAFEAKQAAFQAKVQLRQNQIRYGVAMAQRQVETVAGPIVQGLMMERGANLMIDRQAIVIGAPGLDVTPVAIQRLDQKLPSVKVQLATPPTDMMQRMQPAQGQ